MSTISYVNISEGNGAKRIATYRIIEDEIQKELHRFVFSNSLGEEMIIPALNSQNSLYSNIYADFQATSTENTKNIVISGIVNEEFKEILNIQHFLFGAVKKIGTDGKTKDLPLNDISWTPNIYGGTLTINGIDNFITGDKVAVVINGPLKGYDISTNTIKTPDLDSDEDSIAVAIRTDYLYDGKIKIAPIGATVNITDTADVISGITAQQIRILSFVLTPGADVDIKFQKKPSGAGTDLPGVYSLKAGVALPMPFNPVGYYTLDAGNAARIVMSTPTSLKGWIQYIPV